MIMPAYHNYLTLSSLSIFSGLRDRLCYRLIHLFDMCGLRIELSRWHVVWAIGGLF